MRVWEPNKRPKPARKRLAHWLVWILLAAALAFGLTQTWLNKRAAAPDNQQTAEITEESGQYSLVKGKYLFSGTVVIARAVENEARRPDGSIDYDQPFSRFDSFNPAQYDAWEFDHECPMTTNNIPYETQVQNTVFNCRPEFLPAMKKVFPNIIANVANNHTRDMGDDGFTQTVKHLEDGGIQTIGHWNPREKDDICQVIALPVRLQKPGGGEDKAALPVAFCAWHYFEKDPMPDELAAMDRFAEIMPVFAFVQVGVEYRDSADQKQVNIAHALIDEHDPEFVIQNSAHWVQNTEAYKGKLVVYSTGNFIFDQLDAETNRGLSIDAEMTVPYDKNVQAWLDLGKTCRPRSDGCLDMARQSGLKKVDIELKYKPVVSITGYRQLTQKAPADIQAAVEARARWQQTIAGLD